VHCGKTQENYVRLACDCLRRMVEGRVHTPPSPCNQVCRIDSASGLCLGCKRTLEEIADWSMLSHSDKLKLLDRLKTR
jgi:predicted Fe-S protein YdhL (DUF1289 family)